MTLRRREKEKGPAHRRPFYSACCWLDQEIVRQCPRAARTPNSGHRATAPAGSRQNQLRARSGDPSS